MFDLQTIETESKVDANGNCFCSVEGVARLVDVDYSVLLELFEGNELEPTNYLAQILMNKGFKPGEFSKNGIPHLAVILIIEYYAFDAGKQCKEQAKQIYRALSSVGIALSIQSALGYKLKQPDPIKDELEQQLHYLDLAIGDTLAKPLVAGLKLNHTKRMQPALAPAVEEAHSLIASTNANLLVGPRQIGAELGISAIRVNRLLVNAGLQNPNLCRTSKTDPTYLPTKLGTPYASFTAAIGSNNESAFQQVKWKREVIEIVRRELAKELE